MDRRLDSPVFLFHLRTAHAFGLQRFHERGQVIAHEVEDRAQKLASAVELTPLALRRMNAHFGGRQGKYEPAAARIHGAKAENVTKEGAIGLGVVAVEEDVSADNSRGHERKFIKRLPGYSLNQIRKLRSFAPRDNRGVSPHVAVFLDDADKGFDRRRAHPLSF